MLVAGLLRFGGPRPESEKRAPAPAEASAADQSPSPESHAERADEEAVDLTAIAVAAYGAHRRHRVDPGSAKPIGDWVHAGRIRASAPFQR